MQMLTKFESKSNRVKGVSFHPKLSLLAASLHSGSIQIWNYTMGTLVHRFDEHDGPVRGLDFAKSGQPLLASGGDDYKIKVFNFKQQRCLFTLHGHLDYVRTVFFSPSDQPWLMSASDDQTIRIWNHQSRQCIAILTGHNHYIMSANWHPTSDLIVSASMDQTVRVWDISGLRKKSTSAQPMTFEDQIQRANAGAQNDLFGNADATVKFVLEGHDRGVNWAAFHPSLPLIVSCGDDRQIKLWRMSETKAWEVDTCRGHFNNVSSALFHPRHELILSDAEDKTIRVWDMSKRTAVQTFRRENDRFWVLTAHPELNLFAAGHDSGLIVFKLDRERPAFAIHGTTLFYIRDKYVRAHDLSTGSDASVISVRRLGSQYIQPRTLSYNPAERSVLVTTTADNGLFELVQLPKDIASGEVRDSTSEGKRGAGAAALFVARNRFAVLDKANQQIEVRDLSNSVTKTIKCPAQINEIFYGGTASLLLSTPTSVILFDIQQQKVLAELATPPVKYAVWSTDGSMVALLSKHTILLANKSLSSSCLVHETIRIKSGAWDDTGIFVYSTLNHIKYALPSGDNGIIKTLDQPIYITRVKGKAVHCLDRTAKPRIIEIDPTEYRFKLALSRQNYDEVLHIIKTSNLVGQSIIAYLQKKGYPEIALHFVQDESTRFDLAIECGNLDVALEMARALGRDECWQRLGQQALKQGNHKTVEIAYQQVKNFDKLSFLYLATGNTDKLARMAKIADARGDFASRFQNAIYLGNVASRIEILRDVGLNQLAYLTAKTNGMDEVADEILAESGHTAESIASRLPSTSKDVSSLSPPPVVTQTGELPWPTIGKTESFFDRALAAAANGQDTAVSVPLMNGFGDVHDDAAAVGDEWGADADVDDVGVAPEEVEDAWDVAVEPEAAASEAVDNETGADPPSALGGIGAGEAEDIAPGLSEAELYVRNSPLAADHVAAGSFETAMSLLNRQVGAIQFEPLKPLFLALYRSSRVFLPASASLPPLVVHLRRTLDATEGRSLLPAVARPLSSITGGELRQAHAAFLRAAFAESADLFRSILRTLLLVVASSPAEEQELRELIISCREYILGLSIEIERRRLATAQPADLGRQLALAAYFTACKLQPQHSVLALRLAMTTFQRARNTAGAASFASRLLAMPSADAKAKAQATTIMTAANTAPRDPIEVPYDPHTAFSVCAATLQPIYGGAPSVGCPFCGALYTPEHRGQVCRLDGVAEIGGQATGFRCRV